VSLADRLWKSYFTTLWLLIILLACFATVFVLGLLDEISYLDTFISWHDVRSWFILEAMIITGLFFAFSFIVGLGITILYPLDEKEGKE
jgi:hypothetical protein